MRRQSNTAKSTTGPPIAGFSLIEMLCVIAIIGILAAVTVPIISGMDRVSVTKSKRNAQMTVDVSNQLTALDVAHILPESLGGAAATVRLLQIGIMIENGELAGAKLGVKNLPEDEVETTAEYIELVSDITGLRFEFQANSEVD